MASGQGEVLVTSILLLSFYFRIFVFSSSLHWVAPRTDSSGRVHDYFFSPNMSPPQLVPIAHDHDSREGEDAANRVAISVRDGTWLYAHLHAITFRDGPATNVIRRMTDNEHRKYRLAVQPSSEGRRSQLRCHTIDAAHKRLTHKMGRVWEPDLLHLNRVFTGQILVQLGFGLHSAAIILPWEPGM